MQQPTAAIALWNRTKIERTASIRCCAISRSWAKQCVAPTTRIRARGQFEGPTASQLFVGQIEPDMQLPQLALATPRTAPHHQVLGALVHREQHDLAQVLLARIAA